MLRADRPSSGSSKLQRLPGQRASAGRECYDCQASLCEKVVEADAPFVKRHDPVLLTRAVMYLHASVCLGAQNDDGGAKGVA